MKAVTKSSTCTAGISNRCSWVHHSLWPTPGADTGLKEAQQRANHWHLQGQRKDWRGIWDPVFCKGWLLARASWHRLQACPRWTHWPCYWPLHCWIGEQGCPLGIIVWESLINLKAWGSHFSPQRRMFLSYELACDFVLAFPKGHFREISYSMAYQQKIKSYGLTFDLVVLQRPSEMCDFRILSVSLDNTLRVWEPDTFHTIRSLHEVLSEITCLTLCEALNIPITGELTLPLTCYQIGFATQTSTCRQSMGWQKLFKSATRSGSPQWLKSICPECWCFYTPSTVSLHLELLAVTIWYHLSEKAMLGREKRLWTFGFVVGIQGDPQVPRPCLC